MKRKEFEARLGLFGLHLMGHQQTSYHAESDGVLLALRPYGEDVKHASLAISISSPKNIKAIVDTFFVAAGVRQTKEFQRALATSSSLACTIDGKDPTFLPAI